MEISREKLEGMFRERSNPLVSQGSVSEVIIAKERGSERRGYAIFLTQLGNNGLIRDIVFMQNSDGSLPREVSDDYRIVNFYNNPTGMERESVEEYISKFLGRAGKNYQFLGVV